jgi:hypothetical protein
VSELVHLAGGDIVHPFAFLPVVRRYGEVIRSQLVQHEPALFELRVTTGERSELEKISDPLASELSDVLGGAKVEVAYDESLASRTGKHVPVVPLRQ